MERNATRMCALLIGCVGCGNRARLKDRRDVSLVDLTAFGRPAVLVWDNRRWSCPEADCPVCTFTEVDRQIATTRAKMTDRAARWVTVQVGRACRNVAEVAAELGCDWHTVIDAVAAWRTSLLAADTSRTDGVTALGLDETLFIRRGAHRTKSWATSVVDGDVGAGDRDPKLIEVIEGRTAATVPEWIDAQPRAWRDAIRWETLGLSGSYAKLFNESLPHAVKVADPFHVVKHANSKVDECRRRVQNDKLGNRGDKDDPLYRCRRLLTKAHEHLDDNGETKLVGLLEAGDPHGDVRMAWHAKETVRGLYAMDDPDLAAEFIDEPIDNMADESMPVEVRSLAATLRRWRDKILARHTALVTNGRTEDMNNPIKRIKRVGFGFRRFDHHRIRALLYAGRPNWAPLDSITPR